MSEPTACSVPMFTVGAGGPVGVIAKDVTCHGTVCGSHLNDVGMGHGTTVYVMVWMDYFAC